MPQKATYVLVHGAWEGGWLWKHTREALLAAGHNVYVPTLTGLGERSHLNAPAVNLSTHIADVVNLMDWEGLSNVILVGHSYGGCVITGVADRVGDRLRHLFYLDGFVPDDGEHLFDLRPPEDNVIMHQLVNEFGGGWNMSPLTAETFNVNPKDSEWFDKKCTSQAIATFDEPIRLTNGQFPVHKVSYVHASNWDFKPHTGRSYEKAKSRGWETHVIDCGHAVMLDRPETLNGWLLRLGEP